MKYVYIKENLGWRSIILWDMIMVILFVSGVFPHEFPSLFYAEWHVAYRILLGFCVGILFLTLCCIKYIGILFQIAATIFWTILFSEIFENFDFSFSFLILEVLCSSHLMASIIILGCILGFDAAA